MYREWFGKTKDLRFAFPLSRVADSSVAITNFLTAQGYRDVSCSAEGVVAVRGSKIMNVLNAGDPRRHYHRTSVLTSSGELTVATHVDTWFGLGTKHDVAVFEAEAQMLHSLLETGQNDDAPLRSAQSLRRRADAITFLLAAALGVLLGVCALGAWCALANTP